MEKKISIEFTKNELSRLINAMAEVVIENEEYRGNDFWRIFWNTKDLEVYTKLEKAYKKEFKKEG